MAWQILKYFGAFASWLSLPAPARKRWRRMNEKHAERLINAFNSDRALGRFVAGGLSASDTKTTKVSVARKRRIA